jgi:enoyl-[acyl-carrier protein] reductase I
VTALPGACTFDSAMSFGLIRGGHLDLTVLGGLQVDQEGHLANWMIPGKMVPGMGGAMDLVTGAKRVIVAMQHTAKGSSKLVKECRLPITSSRTVDLLVTELAVISFGNGQATLLETGPGVSIDQVLLATEARLIIPEQVPQMSAVARGVSEDQMPPKPDLNNSLKIENKKKSLAIPSVKAKLLEGKRGLIVGIANENSIAWGCAKAFHAFGAELAVTYLNDKARKYVEPLAQAVEAQIVMPLDVRAEGQLEAVFERIAEQWGSLDFVVHSIAFSPKDALQGRVADVSRDGFLTTMEVSCWTFIRMAHLAEPLMRKGGTLFTMTYYGSQMVVKNYNIMGVAKAALESAVRYLAAELGPKGIRVHAISPGPLATRAASGIPEFDTLLDKAKAKAPARSLVSVDDVGVATAFLAHDAARLITGETLYVDGGYHIID